MAAAYYAASQLEGNFLDHSHPAPLKGLNVLSVVKPVDEKTRLTLDTINQKMSVARAKRVRPHLDDKILASWNGLMLGAMARGGGGFE